MLAPVTRDHTAPQDQDTARRRLRTGAARVAREMQTTGRGIGNGFRAEAMMRGLGSRNLDRMASGMNPVVVTKPSLRWCQNCKRAGLSAWQAPEHDCR